ncbi:HNH endonuclease [Bacillus vallismortis]
MQLKQILKGKKPKVFTWHHHQNEGIMQLVDPDIHAR